MDNLRDRAQYYSGVDVDAMLKAITLLKPEEASIEPARVLLRAILVDTMAVESPEFIRGFAHCLNNTLKACIATDENLFPQHAALLIATMELIQAYDVETGRRK